ncbi:hypothetical protein [Nonlabens sp. SY33080]|uniref:hypothetical protein n=1 Tax=Nonlabens sp. SY33080 TaxID=2719911 RepID=UPI0014288D53|nr:hypothetical protein [Nonlabens sp. SY33080]
MKRKVIAFGLFTLMLISLNSFDSDTCDSGYTEIENNGETICIPDYLVGIETKEGMGTTFYHSKEGVIEYKNGIWTNYLGKDITEVIEKTK